MITTLGSVAAVASQSPPAESDPMLAAPALAFPAPGSAPQGVVLDEQLAPIPGASVSLMWQTDVKQPFARAMAQRLAETPLPATRTGRDGTFVLPLTEDQRAFAEIRWQESGCWLVVAAPGYRSWCEPVRGGLRSYLGSRVILRRGGDADPFADVPWPPAIASMRCETSMLPWLPVGDGLPEMSRRGAEASLQVKAPVDPDRLATLALRVTAGGKPVAFASVAFDDGSYERPANLPPLPLRVDGDGRLEARVPAGTRELRITAAAFGTTTVSVDLRPNARERCEAQLLPVAVVDLLAVTLEGVCVPFTRLNVIPKDFGTGERDSFFVFSDSAGRARLFLAEPDQWFVYGDFGVNVERFALDRDKTGADGIYRVTKKRQVTVLVRGDDWPKRGELRWREPSGREVMRAFKFGATDSKAVVFPLCYREDSMTMAGGDGGVPFVIRPEDLPPMPAEPLLDLVELDRTLRPRATLLPRSPNGAGLRRFAVRPTWQVDRVVPRADALLFAQLEADTSTLFARDDAAMEVVATALGCWPLRFVVPARGPGGGELPTLPIEFKRRP